MPHESGSVSRAAEAERQRAFLAAVSGHADATQLPVLLEAGARARLGLAAYRANASALADRALGAVFPTVRSLVGDPAFRQLAVAHWRAHPPLRGDLGEWGTDFPDALQGQADFDEWPYLGDCARLDLAVHACERAADADLDAASLGWLQDADPAELTLALVPGTAMLSSRWPIASIHRAHASPAPNGLAQVRHEADLVDDRFNAAREALRDGLGEHAFVARTGWRARVHVLDASTADWTRSVLAGEAVSVALDRAGDAFDFAQWLATALAERWLQGVVRRADATASPAA